MQIVIDIPKNIYKDIMTHNREMREGGKSAYYFEGLIQNGTPLPTGHGDLIDISDIEWARYREERNYIDYDVVDWDDIVNAPIIIKADVESNP